MAWSRRPILHQVKSLIAIARGTNRVSSAGKRSFEHTRNLSFVIDDQDILAAHRLVQFQRRGAVRVWLIYLVSADF
jgi:hypothetical protein